MSPPILSPHPTASPLPGLFSPMGTAGCGHLCPRGSRGTEEGGSGTQGHVRPPPTITQSHRPLNIPLMLLMWAQVISGS